MLPNIITAFSLACGLFVIFKMAMLQPGAASYPVVQASVLLLLLAAAADVLDGAIAVFDSVAGVELHQPICEPAQGTIS